MGGNQVKCMTCINSRLIHGLREDSRVKLTTTNAMFYDNFEFTSGSCHRSS